MAAKTIIQLVDDLSGGPAAETVRFGWGTGRNRNLEIDLSEENAVRLREILGEYIRHARLVSGRRPRQPTPGSGAPARRPLGAETPGGAPGLHPLAFSREVRAWAQEAGELVGSRGRISNEIIRKFEQRNRRRGARKGR